MLSVALAGLSGLVWGIGDFAGGKAAQRAAALPVAWVSKLVSLPLLAVFLLVTYVPLVPASLAWGVLAGAFGMVGLMLFYRALSAGAMTVVAPVTAVTSAAIPVVVGLVDGERPPAVRLVGVACALVAIALVSLARPQPGQPVVVIRPGRLVGPVRRRVRAVLRLHRPGQRRRGRAGRAVADRRIPALRAAGRWGPAARSPRPVVGRGPGRCAGRCSPVRSI